MGEAVSCQDNCSRPCKAWPACPQPRQAVNTPLGHPVATTARDAQVGGDHYRKHAIQPWDVIDEYQLGFYAGNVLKYLLRAPDKGGVEDLKKARHYLDKLIEQETSK